MSVVKNSVEAVMDAIPNPEITEFMDRVQERMTARHVTPTAHRGTGAAGRIHTR